MPEIRIVLHAGPVVAGECGDAKLSIVYLGDTLNAAARIEETAKTLGHDVLISATSSPASTCHRPRADPLGPIALRGRVQPIVLHELLPAPTMVDDDAEWGPAAIRSSRSAAARRGQLIARRFRRGAVALTTHPPERGRRRDGLDHEVAPHGEIAGLAGSARAASPAAHARAARHRPASADRDAPSRARPDPLEPCFDVRMLGPGHADLVRQYR